MIRSFVFVLCICLAASTVSNALFAQDDVDIADAEAIADYEAEMEKAEEEMAVEIEFALPADPQTAKVQAHLAVRRGMVTRVCDLTDEQQQKVAAMDNKWLADLSKKNERVPVAQAVNPGIIGMFFGVQPQRRGVVQKQNLEKRVDEELIGVLTEEQKRLYETEQKKAVEFRHSATADALIESLQERLDMSAKQRSAIKKKILPWVSRSDLVVVHYFNGNNYYPAIPLHLLDALTDEQRKVYQGLQRHLFTNANFNDGNVPIVIEE